MLSAVGVFADDADNVCGANLTWEINNGVLHIIGTGEMSNYKDRQTPWEAQKENINSIVIDDGVTSVGDWAFGRMNGVTSLKLPDSITSIGTQAFFRTLDLDEFTLPPNLKKMGTNVFNYSRIKKLTIIDTTSLGVTQFAQSSISELIVPESVKKINGAWFSSCSNLKTIMFSEGLTKIDGTAFQGCTALETVYLPNSVESIGKNAFKGCTKLKNFVVPNNDISFGETVFADDAALTLFGEAGSATEMYANANNIPFEVCNVVDNIRWMSKDGTLLIDGKGDIADYSVGGAPWNDVLKNIDSVIIGEGITKIGENAFYGISESAQLSLPSTLEYAAANAFGNLKRFDIFKNSVTQSGTEFDCSVRMLKTDDNAYSYMMIAAEYDETLKDDAAYKEVKNIKYVPIEIDSDQKGVFSYSIKSDVQNADAFKMFLLKYPQMIDYTAETNADAPEGEDKTDSFLNDGNITISGNLGKGAQGAANIIIVPDSADLLNTDSWMTAEVIYAAATDVSKDGDYSFNIHMTADGRYRAYIGSIGLSKPMCIRFTYINEQSGAEALVSLNNAQSAEDIKTVLGDKQMSLNLFSELYDKVMNDDELKSAACEILYKHISTVKLESQGDAADKIYKAFVIALMNGGALDDITKYADEIYSNDADGLKYIKTEKGAEITSLIKKGKNDSIVVFEQNCRDAVLITLIRYNNGTDEIKSALNRYADDLGIKKSAITDEMCTAMAGKSFASANEIADWANSFKPATKPSGNSGGTSGGSSGRGSGGSFNNKSYDTSITEEVQKPQDEIEPFGDLKDYEWAEEAIIGLYKKGIVNGRGQNEFCPGDNITREEFAKLLLLALNINIKGGEINFSDVKSTDWFCEYVKKLYAAGVINGIDENTFGTGINITREDAAVMLCRAMRKCGLTDDEYIGEIQNHFVDSDEISDYAKESVSVLKENKIINGDENNKFNPKSYITRAEAAALLYAAYRESDYTV